MLKDFVLADSHCHLDQLDLSPFDHHWDRFFAHAAERGLHYFLDVCIDTDNLEAVCLAAKTYPRVWCSVGVHPNSEAEKDLSEQDLKTAAFRPRVVAIGETGLDYYRSTGDLSWQQERFRRHIRVARAVSKPLIVHSREANSDTIAILASEKADTVGGVLHCFAGDLAMAKAAIDLGFYISFSGVLTFKNAQSLQAIAAQLPLERILIETDSPYLAPVPHRGKPNYPYHVYHVAEKLAELKGMDLDRIAEQTTENFFTLFKMDRE